MTTQLSRTELEKIRPLTYLRGYGLLNEEGQPREDLAGVLASAACVQLEQAQAAPQELLTVYEAFRQVLPETRAPTAYERFGKTLDDAFDVTVSLLRKDINPGIADWIQEWQPFMESDASLQAFLAHLQSVASLYSLVVGKKLTT
jgi:hypothetical protein